MGSRERKRAERQKRKRRRSSRANEPEAGTESAPEIAAGDGNGLVPVAEESASERRNREAREALEPLQEGERPTVVTIAAALCSALVILSIAGFALWDILRPDEPQPNAGGVLIFVAIVGAMAWGLWRARYWAVLGFQTALLFVIVISAFGLVGSLSVLLALGNLVLLVVAGAIFFFMIKAWARIQMPRRLPPD